MKKFAEPGRQKQGAKVGTALCSAMYGKGGEGACLLSIRAYAPDMQRERERLRASGGGSTRRGGCPLEHSRVDRDPKPCVVVAMVVAALYTRYTSKPAL